ncbi:MAG: serine/threonine-protein kinase [Acidobacteriota bacterium]
MGELDSDRWRRLETLFFAALELKGQARADFLARECVGDPDLLRDVEELLDAELESSEEADARIGEAIHAGLAWVGDDDGPKAPERIGPYRVLREIGRGGLATVYLAERDDAEFSMRVAIKLVSRGMDTDEGLLQRLRQERQILATLDHPNIAKILDGGTADDGRPYFVLEHIEGEHIDAWCNHRRLPVAKRLGLLRQVCDAVHYAHQNLVLHRDIKPSNILVTEEGVPKLLDFGIAKLLRPPPEDVPTVAAGDTAPAPNIIPNLTRTGMQLLTPEYASPEQVRGEALTTASDVYSLGMVSYLLITGQRPYRLDNHRPSEIERVVCHAAPEPPSTAVRRAQREGGPGPGPRTLGWRRRVVPDDLDNVVLMALRKEPARRYGSAAELGEDLRRYLSGLPVAARKDTLGYRVRKFVRRHRVSVAAATLVLATLVIAVVLTSWQARIAEAARGRAESALTEAETARRRAEGVAGFLVRLFQIADPKRGAGSDITVRDMLDEGAKDIAWWGLGDDHEMHATLLTTMGTVYRSLEDFEEAERLLQDALAMRRGGDPPDPMGIASTIVEIGELREMEGNYGAAEEELGQALQLFRGQVGLGSRNEARILYRLAHLRKTQGQEAAADLLFRRSLAIYLEDPETNARVIQETREGMAEVAYLRGDYALAQELFEELLAIRRRELGSDHPDVALSLNNLAAVQLTVGDFAAAEANLREALELRLEKLGDRNSAVATTLSNLAMAEFPQGKLDSAVEHASRALEINLAVYGPDHSSVAENYHILGSVRRNQGLLDQAETHYRDAAALRERLFGPTHPTVLQSRVGLANVLTRRGDHEEAESLYRQIIESQRQVLPPTDHRLSFPLLRLGISLTDRGRPVEAEPYLREVVTIRRQALPADHWRIAQAEVQLGHCLALQGRFEEAEPLLVTGLERLTNALGPDHRQVIRAQERLAEAYQRWGSSPDDATYDIDL